MKAQIMRCGLAAAVSLVLCGGGATAAVLPMPGDGSGAVYGSYLDASGTTREAILLDGIPIALKYDDFWSYSAKVLDALQTAGELDSSYGNFQFSTGVGNLDVVLFTQAGGTNNQDVGPSGTNDFEDPFASEAGAGSGPKVADMPLTGDDKYGYQGWWGQDDQNDDTVVDNVNGPVTVGQVLTYLQEFDPNNTTPVFYVDWNQAGSGDSLFANAYVQIIDPDEVDVNQRIKATWALDTDDTEGFQVEAVTYNYGNISFLGDSAACLANPWDPITGEGCAGVTTSGNDYTNLDHNKGSGKADFIFFAPDMDLTDFDSDWLFVFSAHIGCDEYGLSYEDAQGDTVLTNKGCNTNGAEEGFLTGRFSPDQTVPAPGVLMLLAAGLMGLGLRRRSTRSV